MRKTILITGGAGFIGSHLIIRWVSSYPNLKIVNLDALTYAADLENLKGVVNKENYSFINGDIKDSILLNKLFKEYAFEGIIHLAAESHVDQSIEKPLDF